MDTDDTPFPQSPKSRYGFNAYDAFIAIALTRYITTLRDRGRAELSAIMIRDNSPAEGQPRVFIDAGQLAGLLDRAIDWALSDLQHGTSRFILEPELLRQTEASFTSFSGARYVRAMDAGFSVFLSDLCRILQE